MSRVQSVGDPDKSVQWSNLYKSAFVKNDEREVWSKVNWVCQREKVLCKHNIGPSKIGTIAVTALLLIKFEDLFLNE